MAISGVAPAASSAFHFTLTTAKTFRQTSGGMPYREGYFQMLLQDGAYYLDSCGTISLNWFGSAAPYCPLLPATGFCSNGPTASLWGSPEANLYYELSSVTDAVAIQPFGINYVKLIAAPKSTLPRPASGFTDASYSMFYDISGANGSVKNHQMALYGYQRNYTSYDPNTGFPVPTPSQETSMDAQIVPGIYQYSFPMLGNPTKPVIMPIRYYTIAEGYRKVGSVAQGVKFTYPNVFGQEGFSFMDLSTYQSVTWTGMNTNNVYTSSDKLYFSVQAITDCASVNSPTGPPHVLEIDNNGGTYPSAYFPSYIGPTADNILLSNPLVNSYSIPPITYLIEIKPQTLTTPEIWCVKELNAGTRGVIQLQLVRDLQSTGVCYDTSTRTYQIPVIFGNSYEAYALKTFGSKAYSAGAAITADFDGDGFSNLQEWVLGSNAASATSKPLLTPKYVPANPSLNTTAYFGFVLTKSHVLVPPYDYTNNVQPTVSYDNVLCSKDGGKTWNAISASDPNWTLINSSDVSSPANPIPSDHGADTGPIIQPGQIGLQSKATNASGVPIMPPGTSSYLYTLGLSLNTTIAWPPQVPPYPPQ